jgi:ribonuclease P protein component
MQLKRHQTMKRASEFAMVRARGSSTAGRFLVLSTLPFSGDDAGTKDSRFGIITTKRLGHAVVRNLLRRRIREIVRAHGEPLKSGHYVVLIPRHTAATAAYSELEKDFRRLLKRKHFTTTSTTC